MMANKCRSTVGNNTAISGCFAARIITDTVKVKVYDRTILAIPYVVTIKVTTQKSGDNLRRAIETAQ